MSSKIDRLIRKGDDPILHRPCEAVAPGERFDFADTMERVCRKAPGLGLAAPQVGVAKRVIFTLCPDARGTIRGRFMVNPVITWHGGVMDLQEERCLSYPGIAKRIRRYVDIRVRFEDVDRRVREHDFAGLEARVVQHEVDHLDGQCKVGDASYPEDAEDADRPTVACGDVYGGSAPRRRATGTALLVASLLAVGACGSPRYGRCDE